MAFTTLMMYQLFDVYNCRSRRHSAFVGFFENKWLLVAIAFSLGTHILVIYVPALQAAFHTVPLSARDWMVATAVASSLLIALEIAKIFLRARDARREATEEVSHGIAAGSYRAAE
jgi:P-type Ca2+ transporter type 2C